MELSEYEEKLLSMLMFRNYLRVMRRFQAMRKIKEAQAFDQVLYHFEETNSKIVHPFYDSMSDDNKAKRVFLNMNIEVSIERAIKKRKSEKT